MNLIVTPVYRAFDSVKAMCKAIDKNSAMPFMHILVDDNSMRKPPIKVTDSRRWLTMHYTNKKSNNNEGCAIQLGLDYSTYLYSEEISQPRYENVFVVESDVLVLPDWDIKMVEASKKLKSWATLDPVSTYAGDIGYPSKINPIIERYDNIHEVRVMELNCTLFSQEALSKDWKFSDFPSHFDILISNNMREKWGLKNYRDNDIKVIHEGHMSRRELFPDKF